MHGSTACFRAIIPPGESVYGNNMSQLQQQIQSAGHGYPTWRKIALFRV